MPYKNNEDRNQQQKNYYKLNREKILQKQKTYAKLNPNKIKKGKQSLKQRYGTISRSAKYRKLMFNLTLEEYELYFYNKPCLYCGIETAGIDRIDNIKGYTIDNCVACCCFCNAMKSDRSFNEFIEQINRIHNHAGTFILQKD